MYGHLSNGQNYAFVFPNLICLWHHSRAALFYNTRESTLGRCCCAYQHVSCHVLMQ